MNHILSLRIVNTSILFSVYYETSILLDIIKSFFTESRNKALELYLEKILRLQLNYLEVSHDFIKEPDEISSKFFLLEVCQKSSFCFAIAMIK